MSTMISKPRPIPPPRLHVGLPTAYCMLAGRCVCQLTLCTLASAPQAAGLVPPLTRPEMVAGQATGFSDMRQLNATHELSILMGRAVSVKFYLIESSFRRKLRVQNMSVRVCMYLCACVNAFACTFTRPHSIF